MIALIKNGKKIGIMLIVMLVCMYISAFHYQFLLVQGESMYPTYHNLQLVILKKDFQDLECGDVIAFRCEVQKNTVLIKRIVAIPGDKVEIIDGCLYVNGEKSDNIRKDEFIISSGDVEYPVQLLDEEYFVIGDNYSKSKDSRYSEIGVIPYKDILGVVVPDIEINN